jgi:hypothetical protein
VGKARGAVRGDLVKRLLNVLIVTFLYLFLPQDPLALATSEQEPHNGELQFYPFPTEIGTAACRRFHDTKGRVIKTVYYMEQPGPLCFAFSISRPYREDQITTQSIVIYRYDEHDRVAREEHYGPDTELSRVRETFYECDGYTKKDVWKDERGIRYYESRYGERRRACELYFDQSGENVIAIRGSLPDDIDLANGWGRPVLGVSCGIAVKKPSALLKQMWIYVTLKNETDVDAYVFTSIPYRTIQMKLRDAKKSLVPQDEGYIKKRTEELWRDRIQRLDNRQTIRPHCAEHFGSYQLNEWYPNLRPGNYFLTVIHRDADKDFALVSNTIQINIVDEEK